MFICAPVQVGSVPESFIIWTVTCFKRFPHVLLLLIVSLVFITNTKKNLAQPNSWWFCCTAVEIV